MRLAIVLSLLTLTLGAYGKCHADKANVNCTPDNQGDVACGSGGRSKVCSDPPLSDNIALKQAFSSNALYSSRQDLIHRHLCTVGCFKEPVPQGRYASVLTGLQNAHETIT